ncbi:hypothetical protein HPP92_000155 [Vanilla planifolia]|uniref:Uncharacterized protein n=1 Tax=Vanilla planifolia TaxID=51239 RepID=A0A835RTX7_VANPL|nr:hypothetical protein HPP92_000155 [Vanilla planifolia]
MDALLGSIDSCPRRISTSRLRSPSPTYAYFFDRLQTRSLHIKSKVRDYVLSHHRDFADIFSRCACIRRRRQRRSCGPCKRKIGRKRQELEEQKEALAVVRTVSTLLNRLKGVSDDIRAGRLVEAAVDVRDLKIGLRFSEVEDNKRVEEEPAFYGFSRKEWLDCFEERDALLLYLQSIISKCVESLIQFKPENNYGTVWSTFKSGDGCEFGLYRTLEAMEMKKNSNSNQEEIKRIVSSGNVSNTACIATAGTSLLSSKPVD